MTANEKDRANWIQRTPQILNFGQNDTRYPSWIRVLISILTLLRCISLWIADLHINLLGGQCNA